MPRITIVAKELGIGHLRTVNTLIAGVVLKKRERFSDGGTGNQGGGDPVMDQALRDGREAFAIAGNDFYLPGFEPGGKTRASIQMRFGGFAVVLECLIRFRVQAD